MTRIVDSSAEGPREALAPTLYITATPIGNRGDVTLRALEVLARADRLLCEDTRVTRKLLGLYGLSRPLTAYHDHNAESMRPKVLEWIAAGQSVALVSDTGTPLISDPGFKLARDRRAVWRRCWPTRRRFCRGGGRRPAAS